MIWWGDYLLHSTLQSSSPAYSISVPTERLAFQDLPSPWWLILDGPLSWRQLSLLITHAVNCFDFMFSPPQIEPHKSLWQGHAHVHPVIMTTVLFFRLGFCSLGNGSVPKWWNHWAQWPAVASEGCCDICVARGSGNLWHMEAGNSHHLDLTEFCGMGVWIWMLSWLNAFDLFAK